MLVEIEDAIVARLEADVELTALLHGTPQDSRVYFWNPDRVITYGLSTPGALIYHLLDNGRGGAPWSYPSQSGDLLLFVRGLGTDQAFASLIAERVRKLFDKGSLTTDNWDVKWIEVNDASDGPPEGTPIHQIFNSNISFNLRNVFYRGT